MKSIKGKIATGVVAVGLLSGVGAAFANTDAGTQLQNWYNSQYGKSVTTIQTGAVTHVAGMVGSLQKEYKDLKSNVTSQINGQRDSSTTASTTSINSEKDNYIKQVTDKKNAIASAMDNQFAGILSFANIQINQAGAAAQIYANKELTNLAKTNGDSALSKVDQDLTKAKEDAKSELQLAIDNAKTELTNQLAAETSTTTQQINAAIDAKVVELRGLINKKAQDLVDAQKLLIQAKANDLETTAKAELETIAKGI